MIKKTMQAERITEDEVLAIIRRRDFLQQKTLMP
jgi:hypothetical protein